MKLHNIFITLLFSLFISSSVNAEIVKDVDRFTDTTENLDWLYTTTTLGRNYNDISTQFGVGGDFEGWRFATATEVSRLVFNILGITPPVESAPRFILNSLEDAQLLVDLLSNTTNAPFVSAMTAETFPYGDSQYVTQIGELITSSGKVGYVQNHAVGVNKSFLTSNWGSFLVRESTPAVVNVNIDIKPGSFPNSVNLSSGGVITIAVLGSVDLDVSDINPETLTLGTAGVKTVGKKDKYLCNIDDVSGDFSLSQEGEPDGYLDLICHFITMSIVYEEGNSTATLNGEFYDETPIEGTDSINIVP